jgi:hypothetical protein
MFLVSNTFIKLPDATSSFPQVVKTKQEARYYPLNKKCSQFILKSQK